MLPFYEKGILNNKTLPFENVAEIKKFYEIPDELDAEVQRMLDVINSLSHGLTIVDDLDISPKELQTNVRTLLHILWLKDEQHVLQMVGNKINRENLNDTMEWLS